MKLLSKLSNKLLRLTWFPLSFQLLSLMIFILLIIGGLGVNTDNMAFAKVVRNTNLANLIVWSYWWPLIIISSIFLGRVWCMVCPMELVTSLASKIGLKRKSPVFLRSGWVITLFYLIILFVGIHMLAIHRVPFRMAIYMLILFATAVVFGLLFSRNAFCAHVCPVGHLLGLYARLAPMGWGVRDKSICKSCKDHSCIATKNSYLFQGKSCGVGLNPQNLSDNTQCILCGQCLKACEQNNPGIKERPNPGWFKRPWFKDILDLTPLTSAQAAFCLIVSGFVIYEVFTDWGVTKNLLLWLPIKSGELLGVSGALLTGLLIPLLLFILLPTLIWMLPYVLFRLSGGTLKLKDFLLRFGIAFIPIMASAHLIKSLLKMTSRIPYWVHIYSDPSGVKTAKGILNKSISLTSPPRFLQWGITIFSLIFLTIAIILSIIVVKKLITKHLPQSSKAKNLFYLIPLIYGGGFYTMLIGWRLF
jgi:polyferredoxin